MSVLRTLAKMRVFVWTKLVIMAAPVVEVSGSLRSSKNNCWIRVERVGILCLIIKQVLLGSRARRNWKPVLKIHVSTMLSASWKRARVFVIVFQISMESFVSSATMNVSNWTSKYSHVLPFFGVTLPHSNQYLLWWGKWKHRVFLVIGLKIS